MFRYFDYIVLQNNKNKNENYTQMDDINHYSLHNILSFQLLRNHRILQHINYSFLYFKVLVKSELSMHGPLGHQNSLFVS